jgi:ubiquinol-cytochrome c reductase cytochrome b subunit
VKILSQRIRHWLEHRTGLETAIREFLYEDIPDSSGWHQVFGSVALFLFLVQAFTGVLLAFNYTPAPGDAYYSLKYILTEVPAGALIHGLHHWGATMMIIVVVLHMTQVFLYGGYKKPREATWMVGVVLLLLVLAYGFTGYLLPWDNRAYWATVVGTQIASKAPLMGPYMERLLGAQPGGAVGIVAFARFFGLHVLILPPLTTLLIGFHVYLVRKHGVAPTPEDTRPLKKFFPEQVLKDTVAIFAAFAILWLAALFVRVPLGQLADPTSTTYIPRPDWYFLFLFQLLKFFKGSLEPVGSVVLPGLAVLALFLIPFLDRKKVMRLTQRTTAIGLVIFAAVSWTALTLAAIRSTPPSNEAGAESASGAWTQLSASEMAGLGYYLEERCSQCHNLGSGGPKIGPTLAGVGGTRDATWLIKFFKNPPAVVPGTPMPPVHLSDAQLGDVAAFLLKLTPANADGMTSAPHDVTEGAQLYADRKCDQCHAVNSVGGTMGPSLNGSVQRHTEDWLRKHFANPQALSPGSIMPPYKFTLDEMNVMIAYLKSVPG